MTSKKIPGWTPKGGARAPPAKRTPTPPPTRFPTDGGPPPYARQPIVPPPIGAQSGRQLVTNAGQPPYIPVNSKTSPPPLILPKPPVPQLSNLPPGVTGTVQGTGILVAQTDSNKVAIYRQDRLNRLAQLAAIQLGQVQDTVVSNAGPGGQDESLSQYTREQIAFDEAQILALGGTVN